MNIVSRDPRKPCRSALAALVAAGAAGTLLAAGEPNLLVHWSFDEGRGTTTRDLSGRGVTAIVNGTWAASPAGHALMGGGTSAAATATLPEDLRFGTNSWTLMAWVKPEALATGAPPPKADLFRCTDATGDDAMAVRLLGSGHLAPMLAYSSPTGRISAERATSLQTLRTGEWAHVAIVCDRQPGRFWCLVNGYAGTSTDLPTGFAGDFSKADRITLGGGDIPFQGLFDEVKILRRALTKTEIRSEFERLRPAFQPPVAPEIVAAGRREAVAERLAALSRFRAARDWPAVRRFCAGISADPEATPQARSYAHLCIAQSYAAEGNATAARAEYERIAGTASYPDVHRHEARECAAEIDRQARGLPPRDPAASRTRVAPLPPFATEFIVGPQGDDAGDGSRQRPFATLTRARDALRTARTGGLRGACAVTLLPGSYALRQTLELSAEDSGSPEAPVVYRAAEPGAATLYGGTRLDGFTPVTDAAVLARLPEESRDRIVQCDLHARGITNFGELRVRGFNQPPSPPTMEVFFNGAPMRPARWPNEGFVRIRKLIDPGSAAAGQPSVFEYESDRHARWANAGDIWLFGYFRYLWADASIKVAAIDTTRRTVTTETPYNYEGTTGGEAGMDDRQGIIYYVYNLLEELDAPGEWYLDRVRGILYLYPPQPVAQAVVELGMWSAPMVVVRKAAHVRLEGLAFDLARADGVLFEDCRNCLVAGCTISRLAGNGITFRGGSSNTLFGCDIRTIGRRGAEVIGGERSTLTPAGHVVENCRIYDFGRIDRTYTPAVQLEGVGNRVAHNLLYDGPSSVMRIEGNDHLIEFNDVHSAVRESDDQGSMELYGNPTYRGVVFRYNRFRNIGKTGREHAICGQAAIRFDDCVSGMLIYGNLFVRSASGGFGAVHINGGRDNIIDNNVFVDCKRVIGGGWYPEAPVWGRFRDGTTPPVFFTNSLYHARYPALVRIDDAEGVNHYWRNVFYRCGTILSGNRIYRDPMDNGIFADADPGFVDAAGGDYRLRPDAPLYTTVGFRPIPLDEIGLYADPRRATWPVETTPVEMPDWRPPPPK